MITYGCTQTMSWRALNEEKERLLVADPKNENHPHANALIYNDLFL